MFTVREHGEKRKGASTVTWVTQRKSVGVGEKENKILKARICCECVSTAVTLLGEEHENKTEARCTRVSCVRNNTDEAVA